MLFHHFSGRCGTEEEYLEKIALLQHICEIEGGGDEPSEYVSSIPTVMLKQELDTPVLKRKLREKTWDSWVGPTITEIYTSAGAPQESNGVDIDGTTSLMINISLI